MAGSMHDDECSYCPDGVQPFSEWLKELVALWTEVHHARNDHLTYKLTSTPETICFAQGHNDVIDMLRQVRGNR